MAAHRAPTPRRGGTSLRDDGASAHARAGKALIWSLGNAAVARFGTLAIGIALARLLGPQEFGTYAVAFVALMAILSFNELGVSLAIVRWTADPAEIAPTVTSISIGMSAVLTAAMAALGPWFADAMGDPSAAPLVQLLSLCVLINGAVATPAAVMQRLFRQDQRFVADQVNVWVGAFVSIGLAVAGIGAMSLVVGRLAGALLSALLFVHYSPIPWRMGWDRRYVRPLLAFGLPLAGASVIVFLVGFIDQLIVGAVLGSVALGYYVLAGNLASWPVTLFSAPLRSVAPALFSRLQHDPQEMRASLGRVLRPLAAVALPVCLAISVAAPDIVRFVYGEQWAAAGPVLRWLAIVAAFRIFFELSYDYLVVLGRSNAILRLQIVWIVVLAPAVWVGVHTHGTVGAAMALAVVAAFVSMPLYLLEFRRAGIGLRNFAAWLRMPLLVSLGFAVPAAAAASAISLALPALIVSGLVMVGAMGLLLMRARADLSVFRRGVPA